MTESASPALENRDARREPRWPDLLLWSLLAAASFPVVSDMAGHMLERGWPAYGAVFWLLLAREVIRPPAERRPGHVGERWHHLVGYLLLAVALSIELLVILDRWPRVGRPALAVAALGLSLIRGHPQPGMATLGFLGIPLPSVALAVFSPELERTLGSLAAACVSSLGGTLELIEAGGLGAHLVSNGLVLRLSPGNAGLPLAVLIAGLTWYEGVRRGEPLQALLLRCASRALLFVPVATLGVIVAGTVLAAGHADVAWFVLNHGPWVAIVGCFLLLGSSRGRGSGPGGARATPATSID